MEAGEEVLVAVTANEGGNYTGTASSSYRVTVDIPDETQLEDNVITKEEEKKAIEDNVQILIRVSVEQDELKDKPKPSDDELDIIAKLIPGSNGRKVSFDRYISLRLEKKIGNADWERIFRSEKPIDVIMNLSKELIPYGDRLYLVVKTDNGYMVIDDLDEIAETISFATTDFQSDYMLVALEEDEICYMHFIVFITAILSAVSVIILWKKEEDEEGYAAKTKKRSKPHWVAVIVFTGLGAILAFFGSCKYDVPVEIGGIIVTTVLELITGHRNKKDK